MIARRNSKRAWIAIAVAAVVALSMPMSKRWTAHADALAGSQGTNTDLQTTSSAVTVPGRGAFSSVRVTVNETRDLVNQAVSVSWTGAPPTFSDATTHAFNQTFNGDYMQMFECWGDPDPTTSPAADPGPPPTQCQFGGESNTPSTAYPVKDVGFEYSRVLTQPNWSDYAQTTGWLDTGTDFKILPFKAVDGTVIDQQADYNAAADPNNPKPFWQNPYFSFNTTNEVPFARTYPDSGDSLGHGEQLFQVQTGLEAPGLGCGQKLQPIAGGTKRPQCWLVVVPRGTPTDENPTGLTGVSSVVTSPLTTSAWANRISIPLSFKPVDSTCPIADNERRIVGSELAVAAITSWQPTLCAKPGSPPYSYSYLSDDRARSNLIEGGFGGAGMSVFTDPPAAANLDPKTPITYSPLTLSGEVIGFNIERIPRLQPDGTLQPDEQPLAGIRVAQLNLTPRLVAKLLTQSYQAQLVDVLASKPAAYDWVLNNPASIVDDPDFLQYNPEFALLSTQQAVDASGLVVEEPSSDAATALWKWVLADPEARKWLDGTPDQWGMKVNPIYSTVAANNSTGAAFGSPVPNLFPKSDPYCYDAGVTVGNPPQPARPICLLDWSPYALTMQAAAQATGAANSGADTTLNPAAASPDAAWSANGPQKVGTRFIMSVTDSASAAQYGLQTARLSRAGDDGTNRTFIAPDSASFRAGEQAMKPSAPSGVLTTNPAAAAPGAYPLTLLTYAATMPTTLDAAARADYAKFLRYTTGPGQTPGVGQGQLPPGYVPLPASLRKTADAAITAILHPPATTTTTTTPTKPGSTHDSGGTSDAIGSANDTGGDPFDTAGIDDSSSATSGSSTPSSVPQRTSGSSPLRTVRLEQPVAVTKAIHVGPVRFAVPILLAIGIAALCAVGLRRPRRDATPNGAPAAPGVAPSPPPPPPVVTTPPPPPVPGVAPPPPPTDAPSRPSVFKPW